MAVCIVAGGVVTTLAINAFTVAWMHSIEHIRWEEDYRVEGPMLHLVEARVQGSGAGMDPQPGSRFENGVWHYVPPLPLLPEIRLSRSNYTAGYDFCHDGKCQPLKQLAPAAKLGEVIEVKSCEGP
jgi:hypothetical protein